MIKNNKFWSQVTDNWFWYSPHLGGNLKRYPTWKQLKKKYEKQIRTTN